MSVNFANGSLKSLMEEMELTLRRAQLALESYLENSEDTAPLAPVADCVDQVRGVLLMLDQGEAARLMDDLAGLARDMADGQTTDPEASRETLLRSVLQVPLYLEWLQRGGKGQSINLLSLTNELRRCRGLEPLPGEPSSTLADDEHLKTRPKLPALALQLRPVLQRALIGVVRGQDVTGNLNRIAIIFEQLKVAAHSETVYRFWWLAEGLALESRAGAALPRDAALLLRDLDHQLKQIMDQGEAVLEQADGRALAGRMEERLASSDSGRAWLDNPTDYHPPQTGQETGAAAGDLAPPDFDTLAQIAAYLKESLALFKDAMDRFARGEGSPQDLLAQEPRRLRQVANVLTLINMKLSAGLVYKQMQALEGWLESDASIPDDKLFGLAGELVLVEDSLDGITEFAYAQGSDPDAADDLPVGPILDFGHGQARAAVAREAIGDMIRAREFAAAHISGADEPAAWKDVLPLLHNISGVLAFLECNRAVALMYRLENMVGELAQGIGTHLQGSAIAGFAETMVALEVYLEQLGEGRVPEQRVLDAAEEQLNRLEATPASASPVEPEPPPASFHDLPPSPEPGEATTEETAEPDPGAIESIAPDTPSIEEASASPGMDLADDAEAISTPDELESLLNDLSQTSQQADATLSTASTPPDEAVLLQDSGIAPGQPDQDLDDGSREDQGEPPDRPAPSEPDSTDATVPVDSEFVAIFFEEAQEVLTEISDNLALWRGDFSNRTALANIRRGFHTLKGSGRMVGQTLIGECAWCFENLFNQVLNDRLAPTPALVQTVDQVWGVLERLVGAAPAQGDEAEEVAELEARAKALLMGEMAAPAESEDDESAPSTPAIAEPVRFAESLSQLEALLEPLRPEEAGARATAALLEALAVLESEARAGGYQDMVRLCNGLQDYLHVLQRHAQVLNREGLDLLQDGADLLRILAKAPPTADLPDLAILLQRADALVGQSVAAPVGLVEALGLDQELLDLFQGEAGEVLDAAELILARWTNEPGGELLNDLRREFHTLKGSARLAGLGAIGDLAHIVESLLDAVAGGIMSPSPAVTDALQRSLDRLSAMLAQVREDTAPNSADDLIQDLEELLGSATGVETAPAAPLTEQDQELVQVFLPEAAEILDTSDTLLNRWRELPESTELLNDLRREMHTLKGSSRMAGLGVIGDLAHAVESLLDAVAVGAAQHSEAMVQFLHRSLDQFTAMLAQVREGGAPDAATDLIGELDRLLRPGEAPAPVKTMPKTADKPVKLTSAAATPGADTVRVNIQLLNNLVNQAGESSIYRARIDQSVAAFRFNLNELDQTVNRLRQQLRRLEIETEAQILFRYEEGSPEHAEDFDPLELDRFSELQQLSRSLMEIVDDLSNLKQAMEDHTQEIGFLLDQQSKVQKEIQQGLMKTGMVAFESVVPRLRRVVRQAARDLGKQAELVLEGVESEVERTLLEHMLAPLEHMLRNAVSHGIEPPDQRRAAGKLETGTVTLNLYREGSELVIQLADDGAGLDFDAIRTKGEERNMLPSGRPASEDELIALLLHPGFSTARQVTQVSGRGVGLDVLNEAIRGLRGAFQVRSKSGEGATFIIRLPFSLAVTQALLVQAGGETYAVPLLGIEAVTRLNEGELPAYVDGDDVFHEYGGQRYPLHGLGMLFGGGLPYESAAEPRPPALLFRSAEASAALQVDAVLGNQEIIVKPVSPQMHSVPGISGATVLGDGRVIVVLEVAALVRNLASKAQQQAEAQALRLARQSQDAQLNILVIDDSITMRKVTARFLERHGAEVTVAKDGVDAVGLLEQRAPDLAILDIEMPRMDGYELLGHIRNQPHLRHLPVIMVTSRTGDKHRERADRLGISDYLGKPYQEEELMRAIHKALGERARELRV